MTGEAFYLEHLKNNHPNFHDFIGLLDPREQFVIRERLKRRTLKEIALETPRSPKVGGGIGLTKERIRQIEWRACRKLHFRASRAEK